MTNLYDPLRERLDRRFTYLLKDDPLMVVTLLDIVDEESTQDQLALLERLRMVELDNTNIREHAGYNAAIWELNKLLDAEIARLQEGQPPEEEKQ